MNDLETFIHSIHPSRSKVAAPSARELAMLHGAPSETLDEVEKLAFYCAEFLTAFEGTPLYDQAIALQEQELKLEAKEIAERERRRAQQEPDSDTWAKRDQLRLEKDALSLELHKLRAAGKVGPSNKDKSPVAHGQSVETVKSASHIPLPPDKAKAFLEAAAARAAKPTGKPAVSAGLKSTKFNRLTEPFKSAAEKFAAFSALNLKVLAKAGKPDAWRSASQYAAHQATTPGATKLVTDHLNKPAAGFSRNVSDYLSKTSAETPDTWDEKKQGRIGRTLLGVEGAVIGGTGGVLAHQIGTHKERVRLGRAHLQDISNQTSVKKRLSGTAGKPKHTKVLASIEKKLNRGGTRAGIAGAAALGLAGAVGGKRLGEHAARKQKEHDLKLHEALTNKTSGAAAVGGAFGPIGGAIGGAMEGRKKDEPGKGAFRGAAGSLAGTTAGSIGTQLAIHKDSRHLMHMIHHGGSDHAKNKAAKRILTKGGLGILATGALGSAGAHLATKKYRDKKDSGHAAEKNSAEKLAVSSEWVRHKVRMGATRALIDEKPERIEQFLRRRRLGTTNQHAARDEARAVLREDTMTKSMHDARRAEIAARHQANRADAENAVLHRDLAEANENALRNKRTAAMGGLAGLGVGTGAGIAIGVKHERKRAER